MDKVVSRKKILVYNIFYTIMVFSLVYIIALGAGFKLKTSIQFPLIVLFSLIVKFFLFNPIVLFIILFLALVILIIVQRFYYPILLVIAERTYSLFSNIWDNILGKENISSENIVLFWLFIIILISLFTAITIFKFKKIYILLPIYVLPFLYYWYNFYDEAYWMLSLFLLSFIILMGLNKYAVIKTDFFLSLGFKTISIYGILIVALALLLPKSYNYLKWPWLQEKVYTHFPFVEELRSYDTYTRKSGNASLFDFSITGYQLGGSKLGGPVYIDHSKVMTVKSDEPTYLRGNVKHIYTGDSWQSYGLDFNKYKLSNRLSDLQNIERKSFFEEKYITIKYHDIATNTVFSPYLPDFISFNKGEYIYINSDHVLVSPDGIYKYDLYTVRVQKPYPYGILLSKGINNQKKDIENIDIYLQIPQGKITRETKDLVETIVKDKKTDFEKAVAIEKYLRDNYEYSFDVKEVPKGDEFISHFLFKERKGYCTYFATAMAIMLRLEGIPTRYVEGYLVSEEVEPGIFEVSNKNAHTWVEAFIEPVGWMTFEPTPAYPVESRMVDYQTVEEDERGLNNDIPSSFIDGEEIIVNGINRDEFILEGEYKNGDNVPSDDMPEERKSFANSLIEILLLIVSARIIFGLLYHKYKDIKYKKLSNDRKTIYLYKQILKLFELFGYPQMHGETHYEYAERVASKFYYIEKDFRDITHIFVKSKYGLQPISNESIDELETFKKTLNKRLRNSLGLVKYTYRKYIRISI